MARYNTFKYGDGTKYGTGPDPETDLLLWTFIVAWDGTYSGDNEANWMIDLNVRRGRRQMLQNVGQGFERMAIGRAVGIFDNEDGRYDPWNDSSPLYPNVSPGKFVRIAVKNGDTGTNYGVMRGIITDIQPVLTGGKQCVQISVEDALSWLFGKSADTEVVFDDAKYTLVEQVLYDWGVQWPLEEWPWDIAETASALETQDYWWAWRQDAVDAIRELEIAEVGVLFHNQDGDICWRPRDYTFGKIKSVNQEVILRDMDINQPWENIRNAVTATVYDKVELAEPKVTVWELNTPVPLEGFSVKGSKDFWLLFSYENQAIATVHLIIDPFLVNTQADGGGVDITADCVLEQLGPDYGITEFSEGIGLRITNNSGLDGFIISLGAKCRPIYTPYIAEKKALDKGSIATYGQRSLSLNSRWCEEEDTAQEIVDWLVDVLAEPTPLPTIQFEDRPDYQFYLDIWDRVELDIPRFGLQGIYRVGGIEHQWLYPNGSAVRTTMFLEPYIVIVSDDYRGCLAYLSGSDQSVPNEDWEVVSLNGEIHDTNDFHSTVTNNSRITIPAYFDGFYRVYGQVKFENDPDGIRKILIGQDGPGIGLNTLLEARTAPGSPTTDVMHVEGVFFLEAGTFIQLWVWHSAGAALDVLNGREHTYMGLDYLGP